MFRPFIRYYIKVYFVKLFVLAFNVRDAVNLGERPLTRKRHTEKYILLYNIILVLRTWRGRKIYGRLEVQRGRRLLQHLQIPVPALAFYGTIYEKILPVNTNMVNVHSFYLIYQLVFLNLSNQILTYYLFVVPLYNSIVIKSSIMEKYVSTSAFNRVTGGFIEC